MGATVSGTDGLFYTPVNTGTALTPFEIYVLTTISSTDVIYQRWAPSSSSDYLGVSVSTSKSMTSFSISNISTQVIGQSTAMTFTIMASAPVLSNSKVKFEAAPAADGMDWTNFGIFGSTDYSKGTGATAEATVDINNDITFGNSISFT